MTDKIIYWVTLVFASMALLLFIANAAMIRSNQKVQADINQRQSVINIASQAAPLNQQLSQALFDVSLKNNDGKIRDLLTSQGFTLPEKAGKDEPKAEKAPAKKEQKKED